MAETAYCMKCKAKHPIQGATKKTLKNGRKALTGKCPKCKTNVFRFVKG
jgi:hypothetical protein